MKSKDYKYYKDEKQKTKNKRQGPSILDANFQDLRIYKKV